MARILVVDDDADTVRTLIDTLGAEGYEVQGVSAWQEVPRALHAWLPEALGHGAARFLAKPCDLDELLTALGAVLGDARCTSG